MSDEKPLTPEQQQALFKEWRVDYALRRIRDMFGEAAVDRMRATLEEQKPANEKDRDGGMER